MGYLNEITKEIPTAAETALELDNTINLWADPAVETTGSLRSFYEAFATLRKSDHAFADLAMTTAILRNTTVDRKTDPTNLANVLHRASMRWVHTYFIDKDPILAEEILVTESPELWEQAIGALWTDFTIEQNTPTAKPKVLPGEVNSDTPATDTLRGLLGDLDEKNAMANKESRYRSVAAIIEDEGKKSNRITMFDIGSSLATGPLAILEGAIPAIDFDIEGKPHNGRSYQTSQHVDGTHSIDLAPDPLTIENSASEETLQWIYWCAFHPGNEMRQRLPFAEWKKQAAERRLKANGRFHAHYNTDGIEFLKQAAENPSDFIKEGSTPLVVFNTILYQLTPAKRSEMLTAAQDLIVRNGGVGKIVITDFFDEAPTLETGNAGDTNLSFTSRWRATQENPYPYKVITLSYEEGTENPKLELYTQWNSGRCDREDPTFKVARMKQTQTVEAVPDQATDSTTTSGGSKGITRGAVAASISI